MLKLKMAVSDTAVINGFSYAFLRVLVSRAWKMNSDQTLFTEESHDNHGYSILSSEGAAVLNHISNQLLEAPRWDNVGLTEVKKVLECIQTGEDFLTNFVATPAELMDMSRTPEQQ